MVESTIDKIKDITVERQIRKLAGVIDEQNKKIEESVDFSTDIDNLKASDANQTTQINNLKQSVATDKLATESAIAGLQNKDAAQDGTLNDHAILIQGITESLVSNVQIMPGTTTGEIKVRLERESAAAIDSNNYNLGLPVSAEIIQGTGPSMFKMQITMSTGVKVVSNDFVFTTEAIGTDVYISSFTFKAGNQNGYLSADIGLNNGVTIEANNFLVPTDPNVTSAIADLQSRVTAVEGGSVSGLDELKATVDGHTASISALDSDVANLQIDKADASTVETLTNTVNGKVNIAQGTNNSGKVLGINASGNVEPTEISSGGEVWEEINFSSFPRNWVVGDRVKVQFSIKEDYSTSINWTTAPSGSLSTVTDAAYISDFIEIEIKSSSYNPYSNISIYNSGTDYCVFNTLYLVLGVDYWNGNGMSSQILATRTILFNGAGMKSIIRSIDPSLGFITKMYRLKK